MLIPFGILSAAAGKAIRVAVAGYFAGGAQPGLAFSTVDKLDFTAETTSTLGTGLSAASFAHAGFANSAVAGYVALDSGTVNKFAFPADTRSTLGTGLSINRNNTCGLANTGVAGYVTGGSDGTPRARVDKFAFPSDTRSTFDLSAARWTHGAFQNNAVAGYVTGGFDASSVRTSTVFKIAFPSDSTSTLGTGLTLNLNGINGGNHDAGVAGYRSGGDTGSSPFLTASTDKFAFPSDTRSTGPTLSVAKVHIATASNSGVAGYLGGGDALGRVSTIEKIAYPSDSRTVLGASLSSQRSLAAGFSDEGVF